jgi:hypothetical protein
MEPNRLINAEMRNTGHVSVQGKSFPCQAGGRIKEERTLLKIDLAVAKNNTDFSVLFLALQGSKKGLFKNFQELKVIHVIKAVNEVHELTFVYD